MADEIVAEMGGKVDGRGWRIYDLVAVLVAFRPSFLLSAVQSSSGCQPHHWMTQIHCLGFLSEFGESSISSVQPDPSDVLHIRSWHLWSDRQCLHATSSYQRCEVAAVGLGEVDYDKVAGPGPADMILVVAVADSLAECSVGVVVDKFEYKEAVESENTVSLSASQPANAKVVLRSAGEVGESAACGVSVAWHILALVAFEEAGRLSADIWVEE